MHSEEYFSIYIYNPITLDSYKKLSLLGVIVPYDTQDPEFNTYAYIRQDTDADTLKKIKAITGEYKTLPGTIRLDSIQRNIEKIDEVTSIQVGDIVFYSPYKKLPFTATAIIDNEVSIYHKLRTEPLALVVNQSELKIAKPEDVHPELIYQFKSRARESKATLDTQPLAILDCDSLPATDRFLLLSDYIRHCIRVKLMLPDHRPVLLNPTDHPALTDFIECFGTATLYADPLAVLQHLRPADAYLTSTPHLRLFSEQTHTLTELTPTPHSQEEALIHLAKLYHPRLRVKEYLQRLGAGEHQILDTEPLTHTATKYEELIRLTYRSPLADIQQPTSDPDRLRELLADGGGMYIADVIEDLLEILHD